MIGVVRSSDWSPLAALTAEALPARLLARGVDASKAPLFATAARRLLAAGLPPSSAALALWVPGRVEILGKHTDYAAGRSVLAAATRGFAAVVVARDDARCRVLASFALAQRREAAEFSLAPDASDTPPADWAVYPLVAARRLARNFGLERGVELAFECDLPEASGMSSSSAVVCLTFLALAGANALADRAAFQRLLPTDEARCHYLGCLENGTDFGAELPGDAGVGTFGGSEDHTAIMSCEPHQLRVYSFCPTKLEAAPRFPAALRLVIAVSGATAHKGTERLHDYNHAALLALWAADAAMARAETAEPSPPRLAGVVRAFAARLGVEPADEAVRAAVLAAIAPLDDGSYCPSGRAAGGGRGFAAGALAARFSQFFEESERIIPAFVAALGRDDRAAMRALVRRSQELTVSHLKNTIEETEWLPAAAERLGAIAASAFGAGFGGSCWAMVETEQADALCDSWRAAYVEAFPKHESTSSFFVMSPGPGACCI
ncbi:hypothetical protein AB1Y20_002839 [Prymnesium parvum]|uniref:Galactokinase n=1 Tax=Prymnesium parvum TaxID=97485 RepID=A0AB34J943_PRYPA